MFECSDYHRPVTLLRDRWLKLSPRKPGRLLNLLLGLFLKVKGSVWSESNPPWGVLVLRWERRDDMAGCHVSTRRLSERTGSELSDVFSCSSPQRRSTRWWAGQGCNLGLQRLHIYLMFSCKGSLIVWANVLYSAVNYTSGNLMLMSDIGFIKKDKLAASESPLLQHERVQRSEPMCCRYDATKCTSNSIVIMFDGEVQRRETRAEVFTFLI